MQSSPAGLVQTFEKLKEQQTGFVLATIIETDGSTYRKPGARMLITEPGELYGLLSGGCLEADLYEHARTVFTEKQYKTVFYDMRSSEDLLWGLGLGCDGAVRIRLEYAGPENRYGALALIKAALDSGRPGVIVTLLESQDEALPAGDHYLISGTEEARNQNLPVELLDGAINALDNGKSTNVTISTPKGNITAFMGYVKPALRLLIAGGGPDAVPVTEAARLLGWHITVTDYREAFTQPGKFPCADRLVHATPEELTQQIDINSIDALVLMTHKLEYDERYLKQLYRSNAAYFGLLGPMARRDALLESLGDEASLLQGRVYGPVGLDIGAELPEEIAFSLVAEIQAVRQQRHGGHLYLQKKKTAAIEKNMSATNPGIDSLYGIVLAAGGSQRFGALKQLLEFNGKSLLRLATEKLTELTGNRVVVVHGPKALKCQRELSSLDVRHVINQDWENGMAGSLQLAVAAVPPDCPAVLVLLCDQPLIQTTHLHRLIDAWSNNPGRIVCSQYNDSVGVPAILPASCFPEIQHLGGDKGAKSILEEHKETLLAIPLPEAATDIDTRQDYEALLKQQALN